MSKTKSLTIAILTVLTVSCAGNRTYVNDEADLTDAGELKIIIAGCGLYLDKVTTEVISDFEIEGGFIVSSLKLRQTGIKFINLTREQRYQIGRFIRKHTIGRS